VAVEVNIYAWLAGGIIALCGAGLVLHAALRIGSLGQVPK
jgi:hypothetical protein